MNEMTPPNIITPNNDGLNETFRVLNIEQYPDNHIAIFNRWGRRVYEKDRYDNTWDGGDVSDGVYFYILDPRDGIAPVQTGTLSIVR